MLVKFVIFELMNFGLLFYKKKFFNYLYVFLVNVIVCKNKGYFFLFKNIKV